MKKRKHQITFQPFIHPATCITLQLGCIKKLLSLPSQNTPMSANEEVTLPDTHLKMLTCAVRMDQQMFIITVFLK